MPPREDGADEHEAEAESGEGHDPADQIEAFGGRLGDHFSAEFLNKGLEDQVVGFAGGDFGVELLEHGGGHGAADVIALDQNLFASAHTEEAMADGFGAVRLLGGGGEEDEEDGEKDENGAGDGASIARTKRGRRQDAGGTK